MSFLPSGKKRKPPTSFPSGQLWREPTRPVQAETCPNTTEEIRSQDEVQSPGSHSQV